MGTKRVGWARIRSLINENTNLMSISRPQYVKATATMTLTDAQSGQTVLVGPAAAGLAANAEIALPSAANGLYFRFVYAGNAADAQNFEIDTGADANFFIGGVVQHDPDNAGDDTVLFHPNGSSNSTCTIITPDSGTEIEVWCDGTNWFISGRAITATDTGVEFNDQ
tara:strand:- start:1145 stop:1645 length:501 start_codon:yes stop_codon:yes gene_type:complete